MLIALDYVDDRPQATTIVDSEVLRHADLPDLAARLLRSLPQAQRVRIYPDQHGRATPMVDTGDPFTPEKGSDS